MARARSPHEADCSGRARRYSSALLLLAIASLLVACGGGNSGPGPGGGGAVLLFAPLAQLPPSLPGTPYQTRIFLVTAFIMELPRECIFSPVVGEIPSTSPPIQ